MAAIDVVSIPELDGGGKQNISEVNLILSFNSFISRLIVASLTICH